MKKLTIVAPAIVAAMLSLSACAKHDDAANAVVVNEQVPADEGSSDANAIDANAAALDAPLNDATPGNGVAASPANAQ